MVRNVPLYRQKRKFTCGPSSLMMVMSRAGRAISAE
ncbi:peptidase C39 family protein [Bradyrhizobium barranii]